jgi:hypothetical protein
VLPEDPVLLPKNTYITLNLLFGFMVLLAPLVFEAMRGSDGTAPLWAFLVAAGLTTAAVLGEVLTLLVLSLEIAPSLESLGLRNALLGAGGFALIAAAFYAFRKVRLIAGTSTATMQDLQEQRPSWSLL